MPKTKNEVLEVRVSPGGEIHLGTQEVLVKLNQESSIIDKEDTLQEAKYCAALSNKPIPIRIEE